MNMKGKNVDKDHTPIAKVDRTVVAYELRINGQMHNLDNNLDKIEKEYAKSNARSVAILELSPSGDKKVIKSKTHAATEASVCGSKELATLYREKGFDAWKKTLFKPNRQAKAA